MVLNVLPVPLRAALVALAVLSSCATSSPVVGFSRVESGVSPTSVGLEPQTIPDNQQEPSAVDTPGLQHGMAYENPFEKHRLLIYHVDVGVRQYDSDWEPADQPWVFGAGITLEPASWPIGIEFTSSYSSTSDSLDGAGYTSTNFELTFGGSKSFWPIRDRLIWTFGAGLAMTKTKVRASTSNGDDWWTALYLHSRLGWKLSDAFDIGFDLRTMDGQSVSTGGVQRRSDNVQLLLSFGFYQ